MSEVGAVVRTVAPGAAEARQVPEREQDRRRPPRQPKAKPKDEMVEAEPRKLNLEA
jgi:hypothetical protein